MNPIKALILIISLIFAVSCNSNLKINPVSTPSIIPKPQKLELNEGLFSFNAKEKLKVYTEFNASEIIGLDDFFEKLLNFRSEETDSDILIKKNTSLPAEGYLLDISEVQIRIEAADVSGAFYGLQTLRQLLPVELDNFSEADETVGIPLVHIEDYPKFGYRGMHLDVGRHFFPKEFIKEYISYLAMLKMNYFHWHLTEDQGWRIEIKQFPRLMSHSAYRDETLIGHYNDKPQRFDGKRYGGYYTQEDIKEIVAYAAKHHITIIPEIEMPGHAQAAVSAYPELGCSGEPVAVATKWGVFDNIYCPNQKTFAFLRGVLDEVVELFPGEYIHIGGDEAPKKNWKSCSHCQKLIAQYNLKDEHGLQSWFIKEIEQYLNSKGKKIIGWDEILEGGLAPNATVMSWRGTQGGVEAANAGNDVIMTPTSHAYFDYYQSEDSGEPLAIGGYLPLKKVYGFNPVPNELDAISAKHVIGAQGNVWTEYMKTEEQVQYMLFPRILAMSEVVWNGPTKDIETTYSEFVDRVERFNNRLKKLGINYANHLYSISGKVIKDEETLRSTGHVQFMLSTPTSGKEIRYSVNDSVWQPYQNPISIQSDSDIRALVVKDGLVLSDTFSETLHFHKGVKGQIHLKSEPQPAYATGGKNALINGIFGSDTRYGDSEWLGFLEDHLAIEIELPEEQLIDHIDMRFYHAPGQWIYAPKIVAARVTLENNETVANKFSPILEEDSNTAITRITFTEGEKVIAKKILLLINCFGNIPEGAQGEGNTAWTFIDEIVIE